MIVRRVPVEVTLSLRQQVLRPHETREQLRLPDDDDPDTGHFAAFSEDGSVVGTASVRREPPPWAPSDAGSWRLRGMATAEGRRSAGIGGVVLGAVMEHVSSRGGGRVWCNARVAAVRFYERAGFETRGGQWDDPLIGPHVAMQRWVSPTYAV